MSFPTSIIACEMEMPVAGCQFRKEHHDEMRKYLGGEYKLELWPEPENKHDPNAVRVMFVAAPGALHIGYVPREEAPFVVAAIVLGRRVTATFKDVGETTSGQPYANIRIEIGDYAAPAPPPMPEPGVIVGPHEKGPLDYPKGDLNDAFAVGEF